MRSLPPAVLGDEFPLALDEPFTYQQARSSGISRRALAGLVDDSLVRRLLPGVYVAAQAPDSQLLRARAIRLLVPDGHVVTDESAGWLAGADMILQPGAHLAVPPVSVFGTGGTGRLRNGVAVSGTRDLLPEDITEIHGIRLTTPLRTALDLGRLRHRDRALAAIDQLLRLRFIAEYDGERWHGPEQAEDDRRRRAAFADAGWTHRALRRKNLFGRQADVETILRDGVREARRALGLGGEPERPGPPEPAGHLSLLGAGTRDIPAFWR